MQKIVAILAIVVTAAYAIPAARPYVEAFFLALGAFATLASAISTLPGKLGRFGLAMGQDIEKLRETKPGAKTDDPPKPPSAPTALIAGALTMALVLALAGCGWYQKHEAQLGKAATDSIACVMLHAAAGQTPEEIAIACAGVTATDAAEILLSQKRAGFVLAKPGAAPCASAVP